MTTHRQSRCIHCQVKYRYQASGPIPPGGGRSNWGHFCDTCSDAISEALSAIPRRFENSWEKVKSWSVQDCLDHEAKLLEEAKAKAKEEGRPFLPIHRVASPLFDLQDSSNHNRTNYVKMPDGLTYLYSYWTKEGPEKGSVRVEMEKNLETGEMRPW